MQSGVERGTGNTTSTEFKGGAEEEVLKGGLRKRWSVKVVMVVAVVVVC